LYPSATVQLFSSASLLGLDEARQALLRLLDEGKPPASLPTEPWQNRGKIDAQKKKTPG
jgi:hypothetical protein